MPESANRSEARPAGILVAVLVAVGLVLALAWGLLSGRGPDGSESTDAGAAGAAAGARGGGGSGRSSAAASDSTALDLSGYDVLLITLDTLRADHLGAYGYDGVETPEIDRLAAAGARFERVTATVAATLPAHASIMTGQYPFHHGVRNNASFFLKDDAVTLAESLRAAGYATGGFIGAVVLDAQFGIGQGFDAYPGFDAAQGSAADLGGERRGEEVVAQASAWLRAQSGRVFTWVHLYDPHHPYEPPEPWASRYAEHPYDGEIAYVDAMVGRLRQMLVAAGRADKTLIVLTADHGEGLGDHGEDDHSFFVYDSTVRVPLLFWAPGAIPAATVVEGGASAVDILPTILSLLRVPDSSKERDGVDLTPRLVAVAADMPVDASRTPAGTSGSPAGVTATPAYAESLIPYLDFGWSELRALVDGGYKYIAAPAPELYDLRSDPGETTNLVDADPARAAAMAAALGEMVAGDDVTRAAGQVVDPDNLARLRGLGYLGGGGGVRDRRDIDPKDMIDAYGDFVGGIVDVVDAIDEQRFADANEILVRLNTLIPDQYLVYYYLGQLASEAGDAAASVQALERAVDLNPTFLPTYTQLANALYDDGDLTGAEELLAEAQSMFPDDFNLRLLSGALYHDAGQLDAALEAYRQAAALRPEHPRLLERLGHLQLLRREPGEAADALRRLTRITPENAAAWAELALALAQTGDTAEAQRALGQALSLDPDDPMVRQVAQQLR